MLIQPSAIVVLPATEERWDHFAAAHGARIVEGYPVEPRSEDMPAVFAWTGIASTFRRVGFAEVLRRSETRPIMRYDIQADTCPPAADAVVESVSDPYQGETPR